MNKVIFMGRIASELELKTTPNGIPVCSFRLAVDRNYQKKGEEKVTDFFNIVCWRATAEFVTRYFAKGRMILLEGELQTRKYEDKSGQPQTWYEVMVDKAHFTGEKATESTYAPVSDSSNPPAPSNDSAESAHYGSDYPF